MKILNRPNRAQIIKIFIFFKQNLTWSGYILVRSGFQRPPFINEKQPFLQKQKKVPFLGMSKSPQSQSWFTFNFDALEHPLEKALFTAVQVERRPHLHNILHDR